MSHRKSDHTDAQMLQTHFTRFWRSLNAELKALDAHPVPQGPAYRAWTAGENADSAAVRLASEQEDSGS